MFSWPIMMPAHGVTLADSYDWRARAQIGPVKRKKPAKLIGYHGLTINSRCKQIWTWFFWLSRG